MTLRIGNRKKAFTLIEIMVTTVIFSLATVLIYGTFLRSIDLFNYFSTYFKAVSWVDEKMWEAQDELTRFNILKETPANEAIKIDNKDLNWSLSYNPAGGVPYLYRIDSKLSWKNGFKTAAISRSVYARYEEENQ